MVNDETIVAVFDTTAHAAAAVKDLYDAGITNVTQHAGSVSDGTSETDITGQRGQEPGFWASLFGAEPEHGHDTAVYDRSMQGGSTVVTVTGTGAHLDQALDILERHNPIDIDERAASYVTDQPAGTAAVASNFATASDTGIAHTGRTGATAPGAPGTIQLSEETLAVGKRALNRGTTRVRRYVVETPVEEQVSLHDERVTIERRPVTDGRAVAGDSFADKVIELTETAEEAVVSKVARVTEEVLVNKEVSDRTETVRDTLRREDVEITKEPGTTHSSATQTKTTTTDGVTGTTSPYKPAV